nr:hypothetical protein [uncultured archaeon]
MKLFRFEKDFTLTISPRQPNLLCEHNTKGNLEKIMELLGTYIYQYQISILSYY